MTTDSSGQPTTIEGERVTRVGARWTREEEEQLVVEVRAGTDLAEIARRHGRTRGGIKSRLIRMIPDGEDVPDSEQLAWITARLRDDPGFDWRAQLERVLGDSLAASEAVRSAPRAGRVAGPDVVLAVWQRVDGRELSDQQKAEFLAHPALDDLMAFSAEILAETGRYLHDEHGELLLTAWAAECAEPGLTGLPASAELGLSLARTAGAVRVLVAALVGAVRSDSDRAVLQRRLGMHGGALETLRQIGDDLGLSRERVRQRQERAIGQMRSAVVLPGHRFARDQARDRLIALVTGEDGTPDGGLVRAVAALGLPQVDRTLAAKVIAKVTEAGLHERDVGRGGEAAG